MFEIIWYFDPEIDDSILRTLCTLVKSAD